MTKSPSAEPTRQHPPGEELGDGAAAEDGGGVALRDAVDVLLQVVVGDHGDEPLEGIGIRRVPEAVSAQVFCARVLPEYLGDNPALDQVGVGRDVLYELDGLPVGVRRLDGGRRRVLVLRGFGHGGGGGREDREKGFSSRGVLKVVEEKSDFPAIVVEVAVPMVRGRGKADEAGGAEMCDCVLPYVVGGERIGGEKREASSV